MLSFQSRADLRPSIFRGIPMIHPRLAFVFLTILAGSFWAKADDVTKLDEEKAQMIAKLCVNGEATSKKQAPLKITPAVKNAVGFNLKKRAAIVVPSTDLTAATIAKADKEIVPIGVLYLYGVTPVVVDEPLAQTNHRTFEIKVEGKSDVLIAAMQLAVTKVAGKPVLLVYSDAKEPVLVTTLVETKGTTDIPLELEVAPAGDQRAILTLKAFGAHRGSIMIAAMD